MLDVIIEEDLYDHDFVENWCYGFDELAERVQGRDAGRAGRRDRLASTPEDIRKAARLFAAGNPAAMQWGLDGRHDRRERHLRRLSACIVA